MLSAFRMFLFFQVLTVTAVSSEFATIEFDRSLLFVSPKAHEVSYPGYLPTGVGREILVCSKPYYIELLAGEQADSVSFTVAGRQLIDLPALETPFDEIPTSSSSPFYDTIASSASFEKIGREAVYCDREFFVDGKRYLKLSLFPVTLDSIGQAFFNQSVTILVGSRILHQDQLLSYQTIYGSNRRGKGSFASTVLSQAEIDYAIITSSELAAPCRELAQYKTSVGYRTVVVLVDSVLAIYPGRDDAEKLREYLKQFYADGGRYVLLVGDKTVLPLRYAYHRATDAVPPLESQQICDLYFADLSGEWDLDSDGVWGEPIQDAADLTPELFVGRLPFHTPGQVSNYVNKLIAYETSPGGGDRSYLRRAFFFCSDQMRDYSGGGQHGRIAQAYPDNFLIDTVNGVEASSGGDPAPYNKRADELIETLSDGWGIVNVIAHGSNDLFAVRTSGYNNWPKSCFMSQAAGSGNGNCYSLSQNGRTSFYYSLACDNGAFDKDQAPFNQANPNLVESLLDLNMAGAVGFVANSRWGWVSSSYLLQKTFFDTLFAHPDRPAVAAMYASKLAYYYYRDLAYGQNFYGDPTLRVYTDVPDTLSVMLYYDSSALRVTVTAHGNPLPGCHVVLSDSGNLIMQAATGSDGLVSFAHDFGVGSVYTISVCKTGYTVSRTEFVPSIITSIEEDKDPLSRSFSLAQNYPNPFNPTTTISFDLATSSRVELSVYNVLGQLVRSLGGLLLPAGSYTVEWDGRNDDGGNVASGVYFYRLKAEHFTAVKKMVLLR